MAAKPVGAVQILGQWWRVGSEIWINTGGVNGFELFYTAEQVEEKTALLQTKIDTKADAADIFSPLFLVESDLTGNNYVDELLANKEVGITYYDGNGLQQTVGLFDENGTLDLSFALPIPTNKTINLTGISLDFTGLKNQIQEVSEDLSKVTIVAEQLFNNATMLAGSYDLLGVHSGATNNWISTPKIAIEEGKSQITSSGHGSMSGSQPRFLFFDENDNFISYILAVSLSTGPETALIPVNAKSFAINVSNFANIGLNPTASQYAGTFMVNYGASALPFELYNSDGLFLNGTKIKNLVIPQPYANGYFTYNMTGASGRERMFVFSKFEGTDDMYIGVQIDHVYDMSPLIWSDQFRLMAAKLYKYSGSEMIDQGVILITSGESECVYRCFNRDDFTGGFHGDEIYSKIEVFIDERPFDMGENVSLLPFDIFQYRQISTTHQTALAGVPAPGHPVEAIHHKITTIAKSSYNTYNRLTWQADGIAVDYWYPNISCIGKSAGQFVENEYIDRAEMTGDNTFKLSKIGAKHYLSANEATGLAAIANGTMLKPLPYGTVSSVVNPDNTCEMIVWDRADADNKYYRKYTKVNPIVSGEEWLAETNVKFTLKIEE